MVWEQELYNNFKYYTPRTYFHTFVSDVSRSMFLTVQYLLFIENNSTVLIG